MTHLGAVALRRPAPMCMTRGAGSDIDTAAIAAAADFTRSLQQQSTGKNDWRARTVARARAVDVIY